MFMDITFMGNEFFIVLESYVTFLTKLLIQLELPPRHIRRTLGKMENMFFIIFYRSSIWPQTHLILSDSITHDGRHVKYSRETNSQRRMMEHTYRCLTIDFQFEGGIEMF